MATIRNRHAALRLPIRSASRPPSKVPAPPTIPIVSASAVPAALTDMP